MTHYERELYTEQEYDNFCATVICYVFSIYLSGFYLLISYCASTYASLADDSCQTPVGGLLLALLCRAM